MCSELLLEAGISLSELDGIAFSRGPGSFTGLRIGAGVVQGMAYAQDLPVINISSLDALAYFGARKQPGKAILASIDARMGEVYWRRYHTVDTGLLISDTEEQLSRPEDIKHDGTSHLIGVGTGLKLILENDNSGFNLKDFDHIYSDQLVSAEEIALLAANNTDKNAWQTAEQAIPVYLRNNVVHQR